MERDIQQVMHTWLANSAQSGELKVSAVNRRTRGTVSPNTASIQDETDQRRKIVRRFRSRNDGS